MIAYLLKFKFVQHPESIFHSIQDMDGVPDVDKRIAAANLTFSSVNEMSSVALLPFGLGGNGRGNVVRMPPEAVSHVRQQLLQEQEQLSDDHVLLSVDPSFNRDILNGQRITTTRVLGAMALVGIETALPVVPILPREELSAIREKIAPEREVFLDSLAKHVSDARERIQAGIFNDAFDYAQAVTAPELRARIREYDKAVAAQAVSIRRRIASNIVEDLPTVGLVIERTIQGAVIDQRLAAAMLARLFRPIWDGLAGALKDKVKPIEIPDDLAFVVGLREEMRHH